MDYLRRNIELGLWEKKRQQLLELIAIRPVQGSCGFHKAIWPKMGLLFLLPLLSSCHLNLSLSRHTIEYLYVFDWGKSGHTIHIITWVNITLKFQSNWLDVIALFLVYVLCWTIAWGDWLSRRESPSHKLYKYYM